MWNVAGNGDVGMWWITLMWNAQRTVMWNVVENGDVGAQCVIL